MAKRRSVSLAALITNPRKRKASRKSGKSRARKSRRSRARKNGRSRGRIHVKAHSRGKARRSSKRRHAKRNPARARKSRRSAPRVFKRNGRKHARKSFRRNGRGARRTFKMKRNGRSSYRRNGRALLGGISATFAKLPLIGGPLASMIAALPMGALAGVSVEVPIQASAWLADKEWVPSFIKDNEFVYFTLLGGITGGVLGSVAKMAKFKGAPHIVALCTAAGAGAGWAKMRTRQIANEAGIATPEQQASGSADKPTAGLGALVAGSSGLGAITADMGMGPAYAVGPAGYSGMGALSVASL